MTTKTATPIHSAQRPDVEAWLDSIGATWTFAADFVLAKVDQGASLANQVRHEPLNAEVVERYAADMARGDRFPPLLIGTDGAILGGNHRYAAHLHVNHTTAPAYIVAGTDRVLMQVRFQDNARHGMPPTMAERIGHATMLMADGVTQADAAAIVGVPAPKLTIATAVLEAGRRADDAGLDGFARLPETTRYKLSQLDDDDVFTEASALTLRAGLPLKDVGALVRAASGVEPAEALRIIGAEAEDHRARATQRSGNVRASSRTARARLDGALAEIRSLDPADIDATCPNDDVRAVLAQRILDAAGVMHRAHELLTKGR